MIGATYTRKADKARFAVTYDEAAAQFILTPEQFGTPIALSADDLKAQFSNVRGLRAPAATDEVDGWKRIGAAFDRMRSKRPRVDGILTPEEVLSGRARERAETIAADPGALADHAVGLLPVSREVAAALDDIAAQDATEADAEDKRADRVTAAEARRLGHR